MTKLLNPAYAAIHSATPDAKVGGGVTAPRGVDRRRLARSPGSAAWAPRTRGSTRTRTTRIRSSRFETPSTGGCDHCETITMATIERLQREVSRRSAAQRGSG